MRRSFGLCAIAALSFTAAATVLALPPPPAAAKFLGLFDHLRDAEAHVTVKVFPANYISTFTVVGFDAVERWKPGTVPAILRPVLTGRKTVSVDCRFRAESSRLTFTVEKAYYQGVRLPAALARELIAVVAARQPEKYDVRKPTPLPFGLRRLWTDGHAFAGEN